MVEAYRTASMWTKPRTSTQQRERICERCSGKLLYDGESLSCLMCGFEPVDDDRVRRGRCTPAEMLDALIRFRSELAHNVEGIGLRPLAGSRAEREIAAADTETAAALALVPMLAYQSLFATSQALIALARALEPPAPEYGTWGIGGAVIHSAGVVTWLLDPSISPGERALRALAIEADELAAESAILMRSAADAPSTEGPFTNAIASNRARALHVSALASCEVAHVPGMGELADYLDAGTEYRLLSSIVPGRPWALLQATTLASSLGGSPEASVVALQASAAAQWYARATWAHMSWMQPSCDDSLIGALERGYEQLGLASDDAIRFWHRATISAALPPEKREKNRRSR